MRLILHMRMAYVKIAGRRSDNYHITRKRSSVQIGAELLGGLNIPKNIKPRRSRKKPAHLVEKPLLVTLRVRENIVPASVIIRFSERSVNIE